MSFTTSAQCSICHGELPDPKGVCPNNKPGSFGLSALSPGKCLSTPADRARVDAERRERGKRDAERKREESRLRANAEHAES